MYADDGVAFVKFKPPFVWGAHFLINLGITDCPQAFEYRVPGDVFE